MTVRRVDIAKALNISRQLVNAFRNQGMPMDSVEAASAWLNSRRAARGDLPREQAGETAPAPAVTDESFAEIVAQHRSLKERAYRKYLEDLDDGSASEQSKSYATYDKLLKTMVNLEREAQARDLASRRLIESSVAAATFGKVLMAMRGELLQMSAQVSAKANPDNPRLAAKAIESAVHAILTRASGAADEAIESLTEPAEKVTVSDLPEPEETEGEADV